MLLRAASLLPLLLLLLAWAPDTASAYEPSSQSCHYCPSSSGDGASKPLLCCAYGRCYYKATFVDVKSDGARCVVKRNGAYYALVIALGVAGAVLVALTLARLMLMRDGWLACCRKRDESFTPNPYFFSPKLGLLTEALLSLAAFLNGFLALLTRQWVVFTAGDYASATVGLFDMAIGSSVQPFPSQHPFDALKAAGEQAGGLLLAGLIVFGLSAITWTILLMCCAPRRSCPRGCALVFRMTGAAMMGLSAAVYWAGVKRKDGFRSSTGPSADKVAKLSSSFVAAAVSPLLALAALLVCTVTRRRGYKPLGSKDDEGTALESNASDADATATGTTAYVDTDDDIEVDFDATSGSQ